MDIKELIKTGKDLRDKRKHDEALISYESALEICPNYVPALIGKGLALRGLKRYDEAIIALDKAIDVNPKSAKAWNLKGYILRTLERYEEALKAFEISIDIYSESSIDIEASYSWNGKGLVLRNLGRYEEALKAFEKSISINPENAFSWNGKGLIYLSLEKYNEAIKAYDTTLFKKNPTDIEAIFAWNGKGIALANLNRYREAMEAFEKSIYLNPKQGFPWNGKGLILMGFNQFDKAMKSFKSSIYYDPSFIPSYNSLTMLYLEIGNLKGANSVSDDAFIKEPNNCSTLFLKGKIEFEKLNYDNAIYYFKEAISQNPGDPLILLWEVYAKYLKAEINFGPTDKKYQNIILSCTRELEKVNVLSSSNNETEHLFSTKKGVETVEGIFSKIRYFPYNFKRGSSISIGMLANTTNALLKYNNRRIEANINYFLGCCYYKLNDYVSAKDKFINCIKLNSEPEITNYAKQLTDYLWDYKINTPVCKWWLDSPLHRLRRRVTFSLLLSAIFGLLLPEPSYLLVLFLYNYTSKILLPFPSIYEDLNSFLLFLFLPFLSLFSFVNWTSNTTQYALLILLLFFFLIYPCLKSLKGSEVEIEMQSPQPLELTLGLIEKNLKELEKYLKL
ncbi:tetratricopeptide repeat protein [Methanosarcina sp.]|uniref:tetratricopeptide repeat protein n=1 Tax=Methanosarcina sp. TaxID=2213 RepID=UPI003C7534E0